MDDNQGFISRWSRRKLDQQITDDAQHNSAIEVPAPEEEEIQLADEDMPDLDSLNQESDYSPFLSPGVSEELRNLALRKLFHLPEFNLRDGLNDYDDDFSKMPALTEAVASKLRNWIEDEKDNLLNPEESENPTTTASPMDKTAQQDSEPNPETTLETDTHCEEEELGDADLEG